MENNFEIMPHTADLRLRVWGESKAELFKNAVRAMFEAINPKWDDKNEIRREISVQSSDIEALLVDVLSEALTLSDINNEAYFDFEIEKLNDTLCKGALIGRKISGFDVEMKAVTYHGLKIKKTARGFEAEIVFDI